MNIPPHSIPDSTPDSTPEPLESQALDSAAENSTSRDAYNQARADLNALLADKDESTIFDQNLAPISEKQAPDNPLSRADDATSDAISIDETDEAIQVEGYVEPRGSRWPALLFLLLLVGGIGGSALYFKVKADAREARRWEPIAMPDKMAFVPTDWGAETLAQKLENSDKIRDAEAFVEAAKEVNLDNVTPGGYALPEKAGPRELAQLFKAGPTHEKAVFPPGFTGIQITERLQKEGFQGAAEMEKLVYPDKDFSPYEGTLAPGTYWMPLNADGKTLIAQMQEEFAQMVKKLPQPLPKINGKELTTREIVTIASLVERESNLKDEMPLVAGVMMNRLQKPMRLQIDASVQYARILADKEHKSRLYFKDYKFKSPFNTYLNDGLPPTPICNPGPNALMAAARPTKTSALFYVYSPKLKKHVFADNFEGHKQNVARARRERDALENAGAG